MQKARRGAECLPPFFTRKWGLLLEEQAVPCIAVTPPGVSVTDVLSVFVFPSQDSFPARFGGVHFVNQPWYIHALYTLIKPFLKDKTRKRVRRKRCLLTCEWRRGGARVSGTIIVLSCVCFPPTGQL